MQAVFVISTKPPEGTLSKSGPLNYWQIDTFLGETVNAAELYTAKALVSWFTGIRSTKAISASIVKK